MRPETTTSLLIATVLAASTTAMPSQASSGRIICQHTTEPTFSWVLDIGEGGQADRFEFVPRNSAMVGPNGPYSGTCTAQACTAEKPTVTGDTTYRTVLRIDRLANIAQITQYRDNGDIWSKWQATCERQDGSSDQ